MRKEYDFSGSKPNPYTKKLKKQVTIRLDEDALEYFKSLALRGSIRVGLHKGRVSTPYSFK